MCGIYGILADNASSIKTNVLIKVTRDMFIASEVRGKDASGALVVLPKRIEVVKSPDKVSQLIKQTEFNKILSKAATAYKTGAPFVIAGHARMVTNGSAEEYNNNQPVIKNKHIVLHNGIIVNEDDLWNSNNKLNKEYHVDSEIMCDLLAMEQSDGKTLSEALKTLFLKIKGNNTLVALSLEQDQIVMGTSNGSMYYWQSQDGKIIIYASERFIVDRAIKKLKKSYNAEMIQHLSPGYALRVNLNDLRLIKFPLIKKQLIDEDTRILKIRDLLQSNVERRKKYSVPYFENSLSAIEKLMKLDLISINKLKRCKKCLLPSTFPFINFDENGVCQICNHYTPIELKGTDALFSLANRIRKSNGQPDCLVPISGGRDSCYGLHYIKRELGLNPVAYTYDWGLVTDLARRNISRMCGSLGVEHILVAADIRKKRENVRKNIEAWLKEPDLGMIPLFMAGDKMFFYYASLLRKQMGLKSILFSMNWLERTGFKYGFAGINEMEYQASNTNEKTYGLMLSSKLKMIWYYAKQFGLNYKYLNSSLADTLFAFISYYVQSKNYDSIFDYLSWDEELIEKTIINNYGWETSSDTSTTWRIGDGTAPFYNYIYLSVAGFSEHDTFRSNQVREGMISREYALELIEKENQPRAESFKWYCDAVGIDAIEALKVINSMPKLY